MLWSIVIFFGDWFFNCFVLETKQRLSELGEEKKVILFLDNCSAHPSKDELVSADGKIIAKFLPINVTALVQLMDQGVLESKKRVSKKSILRDLIKQSKKFILLVFSINFELYKSFVSLSFVYFSSFFFE